MTGKGLPHLHLSYWVCLFHGFVLVIDGGVGVPDLHSFTQRVLIEPGPVDLPPIPITAPVLCWAHYTGSSCHWRARSAIYSQGCMGSTQSGPVVQWGYGLLKGRKGDVWWISLTALVNGTVVSVCVRVCVILMAIQGLCLVVSHKLRNTFCRCWCPGFTFIDFLAKGPWRHLVAALFQVQAYSMCAVWVHPHDASDIWNGLGVG